MNTASVQRITSLVVICALFAVFLLPATANAAALTGMTDTMTSLKAATEANHTFIFTTPTGLASGETIILTLTGFTVDASLDFEDIDLSYDDSTDSVCVTGDTEMTLAATPSGASMGVVRTSATVITFTNGSQAVAAGGDICIEIGTNAAEGATGVEQITNASAGSYELAVSGTIGAPDSGAVAIEIIADDSVVNTGTVSETLSFSISDVAIGFGALVSANARYATSDASGNDADPAGGAHTVTAGTNGTSGYTLTVNGTTLTSGSDTVTAMSSEATSSAGTEQYGIRITIASGPESADTDYDDTPSNSFALKTGSFPDTIATASGASADTVFQIHYLANISSATESGAYSSTLTYILAGNF